MRGVDAVDRVGEDVELLAVDLDLVDQYAGRRHDVWTRATALLAAAGIG